MAREASQQAAKTAHTHKCRQANIVSKSNSVCVQVTSFCTHKEAYDHHRQCDQHTHTGAFAQEEVREDDIEHNGERSSDIVKSHFHVLQAEIVERDHADEDQGQREDLQCGGNVELLTANE